MFDLFEKIYTVLKLCVLISNQICRRQYHSVGPEVYGICACTFF